MSSMAPGCIAWLLLYSYGECQAEWSSESRLWSGWQQSSSEPSQQRSHEGLHHIWTPSPPLYPSTGTPLGMGFTSSRAHRAYLSSELLHFSWLRLSGPMQLSQPKNSGTQQLHGLSWITLLEKRRYAFLKSYDPRGKEMMLLMSFTLKPSKVF